MLASLALLGCTPAAHLPLPSEAPPAPAPVVLPPEPAYVAAWSPAAALRAELDAGTVDAATVRDRALARIATADRSGPGLHAVVATASDAVPASDGPLAGLPVLVKDNVDVAGLATTAGSMFLADNVPPDDAFLVARLKEAGAVVIGKANLSEWANFRSARSSSGWSAVGGQVRNPYVLDRSPCGSSSGSAVAVAAGYVPFAVATETDGSILCPASINGVVGVKPTVGLVSRDGIVPISHSQDTAGPVAVDVRSAALLLSAMAAPDPADPAAARRPAELDTDYVAGLSADALQGVRIGVARDLAEVAPPVVARFEAALADLQRLGAVLVDVALPLDDAIGEAEDEVLFHEFRPDLEAYLQGAGLPSPTLDALIAFDEAHAAEEMPWFGQSLFLRAASHPAEHADYAKAVKRLAAVGPDGIDRALREAEAVGIVAAATGPAWAIDWVNGDRYTGGSSTITAVSGYPAVTVPMGRVSGLPVGLTFLGTAFDEAHLLSYAFAYEQGTKHAVPPSFVPTIEQAP
ncbi:MAG: amidase [Myxococcota bacterium]